MYAIRSYYEIVHEALPETRIHFVSIKPSRLRRAQWPEQQRANARIEAIARAHDRMDYTDIATPMLRGEDTPPRDLFAWDGLHLSPAGYALWTRVLRPVLLRHPAAAP